MTRLISHSVLCVKMMTAADNKCCAPLVCPAPHPHEPAKWLGTAYIQGRTHVHKLNGFPWDVRVVCERAARVSCCIGCTQSMKRATSYNYNALLLDLSADLIDSLHGSNPALQGMNYPWMWMEHKGTHPRGASLCARVCACLCAHASF